MHKFFQITEKILPAKIRSGPKTGKTNDKKKIANKHVYKILTFQIKKKLKQNTV